MLLGAIFGCLDPVLTIGAILSHRSPFVSKKEEKLSMFAFYLMFDSNTSVNDVYEINHI